MVVHQSPQDAGQVLDALTEGVFTVDGDGRITSINRAACELTGVSAEEAVGQPCRAVLRANICDGGCPLKESMDRGRPLVSRHAEILAADCTVHPIQLNAAVLHDEAGAVTGAVETFRDISAEEALRRELKTADHHGEIVCHGQRMRRLLDLLVPVAASDSTVLILGESGTGKELIAKEIHRRSPRQDGPFVVVNCAALPDSLLETEFFGHARGAFTGAVADHAGYFTRADGGTIFLDEIGELSPVLQAKLLRVLQDGAFDVVGGERSQLVDVRVVAATNLDLPGAVRSGDFREDLYYRINVVTLDLPPLRERMEDVPALIDAFVERFNLRSGRCVTGLTQRCMGRLLGHDWPGNVRELENAIERAFVLCDDVIDLPHLPLELVGSPGEGNVGSGDLASRLAEVETAIISDALRRHHGRRNEVARELRIDRSTLFRKLRRINPD